jgi:hypothetical protein
MRNIYQHAKRVLSWIGKADEDTPLAFSLIERWAYAISPALETCQMVECYINQLNEFLIDY